MKSAVYREFGGLKTQFNPLDAPQASFLRCENFLLNRELGGLVKRGGSEAWTITGDVRGLGGYVKKNNAAIGTPIVEYPIIHRRNGSTSYFDYYNWGTSTWTTLTQGANMSGQIGIGGICSFAQQDDLLCIAAGRVGKLTAYNGTINRLGGPAPTAAPTVAAGAAGVLTSSGAGYRWCYTFYDSTSGWESSPSPYSAFLSLTAQKGELSAIETTCAREGVDKVRIYRTIETGEEPFLYVATINLATTTYSDNIADDMLGVNAPDADDHEPPPGDCYICIAFANRIWVASGSQLWYSKPYIGNPVDLEYFSPERVFDFPQRVTGLARFQQLLLVFMPPKFGITQIRAQTDGEFSDSEFHPTDGTNWHHSISSFDRYLTFWGAVGPKLYDQSGPVDRYDEDIKNYLRDTIVREYNNNVFIWSVFHEETGQFIYCFSANSQESQWQDVLSGISVPWEDIGTGARVDWGSGSDPALQSNIVFGIDPIRGLTGTFSWPALANLNDSAKGITIGYVPRTKGANVSILQETLFLGSINANLVLQTFRGDLSLDNGVVIPGRAILNRIDPNLVKQTFVAEEPQTKRFWDLEFFDTNPVTYGATIRYTRDAQKPHVEAVIWEDFKGNSDGARFAFNNGLARWMHIELIDNTTKTNKVVFGGFKMRYIDFGSRERGPTNGSV